MLGLPVRNMAKYFLKKRPADLFKMNQANAIVLLR